jgi:cobalt-zinc-cadmium efflux system outer membrane protein
MRRIRTVRFLFVAVILVFTNVINAQKTLEDYLTEAARNNPGIKSKFNEYQAALEKVPQVGSLPDPQVTFGYFIQPVETRVGPQRARISASQMFPWFGTLGVRKDAATEMAKSKYEAFEEAKSRLFYDVKSAYYNLYFNTRAADIIKENLGILGTFRKLALVKVEAGLGSSVDVLRVEMNRDDLENQLALLQDNSTVLRSDLNHLLNVDAGREVFMPDSLANMDIGFSAEAIQDSIRKGNHQVLQMEFMEASYDKQQEAAKKAGNPNLMLGFDYIVVGKSTNPMTSVSESGKDAFVFPTIGISIPLYRRKYTSMVKEASLMQESTENGKLDKINILETTYEKANKDYNDADRRIRLFQGQSSKATQALNILQTAYETDGKNFEEILRMEQQLLAYQLQLIKAHTDKDAAIAFINYLMGK